NRRITAVALVVGAAIAILALADVGPFADETEEDRARDSVERFLSARADRDFGAVCGRLTETLRREVEATSGAQPGAEPPNCAEVLDAQRGADRDGGRGAPEIVDVSVSGNRARVAVSRTAGVSQSITLEMVDGEWLVSAFEG
ncbi:MAG: hypothetical protein ACRDMA_13565, partial [Solirubrobacterales bacterium]